MDNLNLLVNGGKINIKKKKSSNRKQDKTPLSKDYKTYLRKSKSKTKNKKITNLKIVKVDKNANSQKNIIKIVNIKI